MILLLAARDFSDWKFSNVTLDFHVYDYRLILANDTSSLVDLRQTVSGHLGGFLGTGQSMLLRPKGHAAFVDTNIAQRSHTI